jgi:hypothetical protein
MQECLIDLSWYFPLTWASLIPDEVIIAAIYLAMTLFKFLRIVRTYGFSMSPLLNIFFR